jgi:hypothetical protein
VGAVTEPHAVRLLLAALGPVPAACTRLRAARKTMVLVCQPPLVRHFPRLSATNILHLERQVPQDSRRRCFCGGSNENCAWCFGRGTIEPQSNVVSTPVGRGNSKSIRGVRKPVSSVSSTQRDVDRPAAGRKRRILRCEHCDVWFPENKISTHNREVHGTTSAGMSFTKAFALEPMERKRRRILLLPTLEVRSGTTLRHTNRFVTLCARCGQDVPAQSGLIRWYKPYHRHSLALRVALHPNCDVPAPGFAHSQWNCYCPSLEDLGRYWGPSRRR